MSSDLKKIKRSKFFDKKWYIKNYPDIDFSQISPARHYLNIGWREGRNPSQKFFTSQYLTINFDLVDINPLLHYLKYGKKEKRFRDYNHNMKTWPLVSKMYLWFSNMFFKLKNVRHKPVNIAIAAIMKNEAPYLREWIEYHRLQGVEKFYLYDNESSDNTKEILLPYIDDHIVEYKFFPGIAQQFSAYNHCLRKHKYDARWLAIIDCDEYIYPCFDKTLPEFLKSYSSYCGLAVNWIMYDYNEHIFKPQGLVTENFSRVHLDNNNITNHHVKGIINPRLVKKINNPHYCYFRYGLLPVTENYEYIGHTFSKYNSVSKIRINHYYCKSLEEYKAKIKRGMADQNNKRVLNENDYNFKEHKDDFIMEPFITRLKKVLNMV